MEEGIELEDYQIIRQKQNKEIKSKFKKIENYPFKASLITGLLFKLLGNNNFDFGMDETLWLLSREFIDKTGDLINPEKLERVLTDPDCLRKILKIDDMKKFDFTARKGVEKSLVISFITSLRSLSELGKSAIVKDLIFRFNNYQEVTLNNEFSSYFPRGCINSTSKINEPVIIKEIIRCKPALELIFKATYTLETDFIQFPEKAALALSTLFFEVYKPGTR